MFFAGMAAVVFPLCSCRSNYYEMNYIPTPETDFVPADAPPRLMEVASWDLLKSLQEKDGYVVIGTASFYHQWVPRTFALECAEKHRASLVLVSHQPGEEKVKSKIVYMPVATTGYYVYGPAYGPYGGPAGVTWAYTSYGSVPVVVNYAEKYYPQFAYFLAKRKHISSFGVYFLLPENIPGNDRGPVRVAIVVPGSPAAKQGIRPGDRVRMVNSIPIFSRKQILPYANGEKEVRSMEVAHE